MTPHAATALPEKRPVAEAVHFALTTAQSRGLDTLVSDAKYIAFGGGSRSGKTFLLCMALVARAVNAPGSRHAMFRYRFNAIKSAVILQTMPKVIELCFPELPSCNDMMNKTDWYMTLPNGSEVWFGGLDDKERTEKILGMEFATIYFNECSQIPYASVVTALTRLAEKNEGLRVKAYFDFNPPSKKHWTYIMFIDKRDPLTKQKHAKEFAYTYFLMNPMDNVDNLDEDYIETLEALPERARLRFLHGQFADESEGALWTEELLAQNRIVNENPPEMLRIVVAVDPSGSKGEEDERSDEIGIVVCGLGLDSHGYLLEDLSGQYKPELWGDIAVNAYHRWKADKIVGETNYGGDMVRFTIQAKNPNIPFEAVTASRGKVVRAEPISSLYEQRKIHHVGYYPELEEQLCAMLVSGYVGLRSPDRGDAAIWGFTALFPNITTPDKQNWQRPPVKAASRAASRFDQVNGQLPKRRTMRGRP